MLKLLVILFWIKMYARINICMFLSYKKKNLLMLIVQLRKSPGKSWNLNQFFWWEPWLKALVFRKLLKTQVWRGLVQLRSKNRLQWQLFTKYLRKTWVFTWNSTLREKSNFDFSGVFCQHFFSEDSKRWLLLTGKLLNLGHMQVWKAMWKISTHSSVSGCLQF